MDKKKKKNIINITGNILTILALIFIVQRILAFDIDLTYILRPNILIYICIISIIYSAMIYTNVFSWKLILSFLTSKNVSFKESAKVYVKSNIGKYIPGNVMQFVNRNIFGISLGLSQAQIALSSFIEVAFWVVNSFILSVLFSGQTLVLVFGEMLAKFNLSLVSLVVLIAIIILTILIVFLLIICKNKYALESIALFRRARFLKLSLQLFCLHSIFLLLSSTILIFILSLEVSINAQTVGIIVSAYIISWLIGIIFPGAPGGIGVREAVLIFALSNICDEKVVLLAAIIHRIISILGDVLAYLFSALWNGREKIFSFVKNPKIKI